MIISQDMATTYPASEKRSTRMRETPLDTDARAGFLPARTDGVKAVVRVALIAALGSVANALVALVLVVGPSGQLRVRIAKLASKEWRGAETFSTSERRRGLSSHRRAGTTSFTPVSVVSLGIRLGVMYGLSTFVSSSRSTCPS